MGDRFQVQLSSYDSKETLVSPNPTKAHPTSFPFEQIVTRASGKDGRPVMNGERYFEP